MYTYSDNLTGDRSQVAVNHSATERNQGVLDLVQRLLHLDEVRRGVINDSGKQNIPETGLAGQILEPSH